MARYKKILIQLYNEDIQDRENLDLREVADKDILRRVKLRKMLRDVSLNSFDPESLFYIAWIFHHGISLRDAQMARRFARSAFQHGFVKAGWLYAAATDRLLLRQGKKQKYGTQYLRRNDHSAWTLCPTDRSISDNERAVYGVMPLEEQIKLIKLLNMK